VEEWGGEGRGGEGRGGEGKGEGKGKGKGKGGGKGKGRGRGRKGREGETIERNRSPNAFIPSSASHRFFCVVLRRPLSTVFKRLPQIVRGPTEIFCLCRIICAQQSVKFCEKLQISTFGDPCTKTGGYLDPQNYTTRTSLTGPYYICKHELRISHRLRVHMERDFEKKHPNQSPNAFIPSSASHRFFCVELGRPLSTVFRRLPQIVRGPTEIFRLCRIICAQQSVKFGEKQQISPFGGPYTKIGGYLDPQNYTTRTSLTGPYYICKHELRISHRLRVHMERDFEKFDLLKYLSLIFSISD